MAVLMRENTRKGKALASANAALVRSNQDLEQFAAAISHDLRSPLAAVSSCVGALAEKAGPQLGKDGEVLCDLIVRGVEHMREMITGLLDYSRASTADYHVEKINPRLLIDVVIETLACAINSNGAYIQVDDLPLIAADPIQLRRVFQNLIGNAIQNRRTEPPRIIVSATRDGAYWRFAVADNGRGIERDLAGALFEPFRRGRTNRYEGTGLGLALCKRVIERHGGRIWVESEPGAGSTFYFTVPDR
jgi:signal transduction histidine kinase